MLPSAWACYRTTPFGPWPLWSDRVIRRRMLSRCISGRLSPARVCTRSGSGHEQAYLAARLQSAVRFHGVPHCQPNRSLAALAPRLGSWSSLIALALWTTTVSTAMAASCRVISAACYTHFGFFWRTGWPPSRPCGRRHLRSSACPATSSEACTLPPSRPRDKLPPCRHGLLVSS